MSPSVESCGTAVGLQVRIDLGFPEAEDVRAETEARELAGAPAAKDARDRKPEEVGDLSGGQERFGVGSDIPALRCSLSATKNRSISAYIDGIKEEWLDWLHASGHG